MTFYGVQSVKLKLSRRQLKVVAPDGPHRFASPTVRTSPACFGPGNVSAPMSNTASIIAQPTTSTTSPMASFARSASSTIGSGNGPSRFRNSLIARPSFASAIP